MGVPRVAVSSTDWLDVGVLWFIGTRFFASLVENFNATLHDLSDFVFDNHSQVNSCPDVERCCSSYEELCSLAISAKQEFDHLPEDCI